MPYCTLVWSDISIGWGLKWENLVTVVLVTFFGGIITMTSLNDVITDFLKIRFRHNQFKGELGELEFYFRKIPLH